MKRQYKTIATGLALSTFAGVSSAGIISWKADATSQGAGFVNPATYSTATAVDIGTYDETTNGGVTYVMVYNATDTGTLSTVLAGVFDSANTASDGDDGAYKLEQAAFTNKFGATAFGVADYLSTVDSVYGVETYVAFVSNGANSDLYINGVYQETIIGGSIELSGTIGIAGTWNQDSSGFGDNLTGEVLGFAAFDKALTSQEVASNYNAYVVPEPGSLAVGLVGLAGLCLRRRCSRA